MRILYDKLVRDRIPEIIQESGRACGIKIMGDSEYQQAVMAKLLEEARELASSGGNDLITELGDVFEVLAAIMAVNGISEGQVREVQERRRIERGGFAKRIKLLWTE